MRSTIHLFGKKGLGPVSAISLSKSMAIPSLLNSLTHAFITPSGAIFGGCLTISALHPKTFLTQPAPWSWPVYRGIQPHVREARQAIGRGGLKQELDAFPVLDFRAVDPHFEHQSLRVEEQMALASFDLFGSVVPPLLSSSPVVLTDWESTMPALGWGSLCRRPLTRWRRAE